MICVHVCLCAERSGAVPRTGQREQCNAVSSRASNPLAGVAVPLHVAESQQLFVNYYTREPRQRTWVMCTPSERWTPLQGRHTNTPRLALFMCAGGGAGGAGCAVRPGQLSEQSLTAVRCQTLHSY